MNNEIYADADALARQAAKLIAKEAGEDGRGSRQVCDGSKCWQNTVAHASRPCKRRCIWKGVHDI